MFKIILASVLVLGTALAMPSYGNHGHGGWATLDNHGGGGGGGAAVGSDHHGGVSIVSLGNHKGTTFDLTKEGGGHGHDGLFGGSFLSTGDHNGGGGGGGGDEHSAHTSVGYGHGTGAGLGSYTSGVSSYDVGHGGGEVSTGHETGEVSPVLHSSFNGGDHSAAFTLGHGGEHHGFGGGEQHAGFEHQSYGGGGGGFHNFGGH